MNASSEISMHTADSAGVAPVSDTFVVKMIDTTPADDAPADDASADDVLADGASADDVLADGAPADDALANGAPADDAPADDAPADDAPADDEPVVDAPVNVEPVVDAYDEPVVDAPVNVEPVVDAPNDPVVDEPDTSGTPDPFEGLNFCHNLVLGSCIMNAVHHPEKVQRWLPNIVRGKQQYPASAQHYFNVFAEHFRVRMNTTTLDANKQDMLIQDAMKLAQKPASDLTVADVHTMVAVFYASADFSWMTHLAHLAEQGNPNPCQAACQDSLRRMLAEHVKHGIVDSTTYGPPASKPPFKFHYRPQQLLDPSIMEQPKAKNKCSVM
jgi:hypothetical protein